MIKKFNEHSEFRWHGKNKIPLYDEAELEQILNIARDECIVVEVGFPVLHRDRYNNMEISFERMENAIDNPAVYCSESDFLKALHQVIPRLKELLPYDWKCAIHSDDEHHHDLLASTGIVRLRTLNYNFNKLVKNGRKVFSVNLILKF